MSRPPFSQELRNWIARAAPQTPVPRAPYPYERVMAHPNPLGLLQQLKVAHPHSMPVGLDRQHRMIYTKSETSMGYIGPARAVGGKSASGTVPIAIEHVGPTAIMSLRSDALRATAAIRSLYGHNLMLDLDGVGVPDGVEEIRWSPLVGAEHLDFAIRTCRALVRSATVINSTLDNAAENAHFSDNAGTLFGIACHHAAVSGRSFREVHQRITNGAMSSYDDVLEEMDGWSDRRPYDRLAGLLNMPGDRELGSILTTLNVAMMAYQTEEALHTTDDPNFNPAEFVRGSLDAENSWLWTEQPDEPGRGSGDTLYLIRGDNPMAAAINVSIVTQLIEARHDLYREDEKAGNEDAHPDLLACLDEMAHMPLPLLPEYLAAPGRGVLLTGMLQDFNQLNKWGSDGPSMLTQLQQLLIYRGERVGDTLRLIESLCPTVPTERVTHSGQSDNAALGASASPERLPGIPTHRIYSGIDDLATTVLYLGADGAPPDWIHVRPYYSDPMLLHVQVKTLWQMAHCLDADDPRRLLPLPNLDRDHTGSALLRAGGPALLEQYREAVRMLRSPADVMGVEAA